MRSGPLLTSFVVWLASALLPMTTIAQLTVNTDELARVRLQEWASACRAVPGLRIVWSVEAAVFDGPDGNTIGATFHRHDIRYLWPAGLYQAEAVTGGRQVTDRYLLAVNAETSRAEAISLDQTHLEARAFSSVIPSTARPLNSKDRLFQVAINAPSLLGCWIADNPGADLVIEEFTPQRMIVRLIAPSIRFELEGDSVAESRVTRIDQMVGDNAGVTHAFGSFRHVPLYPGLLGFDRTMSAVLPNGKRFTATHHLESFEVSVDLRDADFSIPLLNGTFVPKNPPQLEQTPSASVQPSVRVAGTVPAAEGGTDWRVIAASLVGATMLAFLGYRRFANR